jgi:hypothetical protein
MKVTPEHLSVLREAVAPLDTPERRERYRKGEFPRAAAVQNLDRRYRFDLLYASRAMNNPALADAGYADAHLETALKAVVPAL